MKGVNISLDIDEFKDKRLEKNAKSVTSTPTKVRSLSNNPKSARDNLATKTLIKQASELITKTNSYIVDSEEKKGQNFQSSAKMATQIESKNIPDLPKSKKKSSKNPKNTASSRDTSPEKPNQPVTKKASTKKPEPKNQTAPPKKSKVEGPKSKKSVKEDIGSGSKKSQKKLSSKKNSELDLEGPPKKSKASKKESTKKPGKKKKSSDLDLDLDDPVGSKKKSGAKTPEPLDDEFADIELPPELQVGEI